MNYYLPHRVIPKSCKTANVLTAHPSGGPCIPQIPGSYHAPLLTRLGFIDFTPPSVTAESYTLGGVSCELSSNIKRFSSSYLEPATTTS